MRRRKVEMIALAVFVLAALLYAARPTQAQASETHSYAAMAPVDAYLMADVNSEIALARSGAPASISGAAEVMVLGRNGYTTAAKGVNGFLCIVERGWGAETDDPEFWNPKIRSPICFNPAAAKSVADIYLLKTELALKGKSKTEIVRGLSMALDKKELPALEPGAMCYMTSKQQYLNDRDNRWHPHLMFFVAGHAGTSWGANLPGSPVMAADAPEERVTTFMVVVGEWSDGTPGPAMTQ